MVNNSIENSRIKDSEITQNVNMYFIGFENLPPEALKQLRKMYPDEFKNIQEEETKKEIEKLYKDAIEIVNTEDALLYISKNNVDKLKNISQKLEFLEIYYNKGESEESIQYYHNLFVILAKIDVADAIKKFNAFPKNIKEKPEMIYLYAIFSMELNTDLEEIENILYGLYFDQKYENAFEGLVRCYFLQKKYNKVVELLAKPTKERFDRCGFLASIFLISKNQLRRFKETEILKYSNSKFKRMPLFYIAKAHILYMINPKSPKVKEQFKKGLKLLIYTDILAINTTCDIAITTKLVDEMVKFLLGINLSPYLKIRLTEFLINKSSLEKREINKLEELKEEVEKKEIDVNFIEGILLENQGKEIEAINKYEQSYEQKGTINSAYKYVNLSRKNFCEIKSEILKKLSLDNNLNSSMVVVEGYKYLNDYENAIRNSYRALYLLKNNNTNTDVLRQYWGCDMLSGHVLHRDVVTVCKDVGVTLKPENNSKARNFVIEDDILFEENSKILGVEVIRSTSNLGLELINKKVGDKVLYNNEAYQIIDIKDKYSFFSNICFERVKDLKGIEVLRTNPDNKDEFIEQLKQRLIDIQKNTDEHLNVYEETGNIPLSAYFSLEKTAEDYAKIINTLLSEKERVFYAGEPIEVDIENGFVLDLTSIIVLALFDKLDIFTEELCKKIYITTSLKNKVRYYYESLLVKQGKKEMTIGIIKQEDGTEILAKHEMEMNDRISFWADIYKCINKFKVEDVESVKDEILNIDRGEYFDKVQFDLIELSRKKDIPYICDDLLIRKIAGGVYHVKHTNCIALIERAFKDNYDKYIDMVIKLAKCNYIYVLYNGKYIGNIIVYLYQNYGEELKKKYEVLLAEILKTKSSFNSYISILINMINNLKSVQYTKIFENVYINTRIQNIINMITEKLKMACQNFEYDFSNYEKYITKDYGGIELKL